MTLNKTLLILCCSLILVSCSAKKHNVACQAKLYSAFYAYQNGEYAESLKEVKLAQKHAAHLKWDNWCVVETYDDSGLYFYVNGDFNESRIHQSLAVLLAYSSPTFQKLYQFYLTNLGTVYIRLGKETEYAEIRQDPTILLKDPVILRNQHVRQKFQASSHRED